jgi:hypothetical protein
MAWDLVNEVETLYTNGPAGGGGAHRLVKEVIAVASCLMPEDLVQTQTYWFGGDKQEQHTSDHQADQSLSRS